MAKLTREQVNKYNSEMGNEFKFDIQMFVMHGDKRATKSIEIGENKIIEYSIYYSGLNKDLKVSKRLWTSDGKVRTSKGFGDSVVIEENCKTKNFKKIIQLTNTVDLSKYFNQEDGLWIVT